jgi:hypothetical protein
MDRCPNNNTACSVVGYELRGNGILLASCRGAVLCWALRIDRLARNTRWTPLSIREPRTTRHSQPAIRPRHLCRVVLALAPIWPPSAANHLSSVWSPSLLVTAVRHVNAPIERSPPHPSPLGEYEICATAFSAEGNTGFSQACCRSLDGRVLCSPARSVRRQSELVGDMRDMGPEILPRHARGAFPCIKGIDVSST